MSTENPNSFGITPDQIDASQHLWDAFGHSQTETSAGYIIRMFQEKGSWQPFSEQDIEAFYRKSGHTDGFTFNALIEPITERLFDGRPHVVGGGFIKRRPDGLLEVTKEFIEKAYKSSPKR